MVRNYIPKGNRQTWSPGDLQNALREIKDKTFTLRAASRAYNIPKSTLSDYLKRRGHAGETIQAPGKNPVFSPEIEKEISDYALDLSNIYYGIGKEEICRLAYDVAERNNIDHPFNRQKKTAGNDWFQGFMRRNPNVTLRTPESVSVSRAIGFRRAEVNLFFQNLGKILEENALDASRIFNVDETGMSTVQKQKQKILATKGKKQVGRIVSAEKGQTVHLGYMYPLC